MACWIDPFNAQLVDAPFDLDAAIQDILRRMTIGEAIDHSKALQLYSQRWMLWFNENNGRDQRFKFFTANGAWFNPLLRQPSVDQ